MKKVVLASRFDLPFYFRLPSKGFFTRDPQCGVAATCLEQHIGEVSFSKSGKFLNAKRLLDLSYPLWMPHRSRSMSIWWRVIPRPMAKYQHCILTLDQLVDFQSVAPTARWLSSRSFLEGQILFTYNKSRARTFRVLNHFIDIYRIITQDLYVYRIDEKFDTYVVDYSVGTIPQLYQDNSANDILRNIQDVKFPGEISKGRQLTCRLNTLEDLFPGEVLEKNTWICSSECL